MSKHIIFTIIVIIFCIFQEKVFSQDANKKYVPEFYEDTSTGQVFTKPGQNRVKVNPEKMSPTTLPDAFAHRPDDVTKEKLTILGRIQYRGVSGTKDSPYSNGHGDFNAVDYNFRRLRFGAMYENDYWGGVIQLRLENLLNRVDITQTTQTITYTDPNTNSSKSINVVTNERLRDNRGAIQEGIVYAKLHYAGLRVSMGTMFAPFNREYLGSSANLIALERSVVTTALPQLDNGIMVSATPLKEINPKWERILHVSAMVANGKGGPGDFGTGRRQDLTTSNRYGAVNLSPIYYGRVVWNVFGSLKRESDGREVNWQEGEEIFQNEAKLSLGTGIAQTQNLITPTTSAIEYIPGTTNQLNLVTPQGSNPDYGTTTTINGMLVPNYLVQNSVPTYSRPKMGLLAHTYDGTFTWMGIYLNGAYTKMSGPAANQLNGYHVQLGYNFKISKSFYLMPVIKYDYINGDFRRDGNRTDPWDTLRYYWAGVNFFGDKHHFKVQLFYQVLANNLGVDPNTGNPSQIDDRRVYLQVQANFWMGTVSPESYNHRMN